MSYFRTNPSHPSNSNIYVPVYRKGWQDGGEVDIFSVECQLFRLFPKLILVAKCKTPLFLIKYGESCILTLLSGRIDSTAQAIFCMNSAKCD